MSIKICINCHYCYNKLDAKDDEDYRCLHPDVSSGPDIVTGEVSDCSCRVARSHEWLCGQNAKLFKEREEARCRTSRS